MPHRHTVGRMAACMLVGAYLLPNAPGEWHSPDSPMIYVPMTAFCPTDDALQTLAGKSISGPPPMLGITCTVGAAAG